MAGDFNRPAQAPANGRVSSKRPLLRQLQLSPPSSPCPSFSCDLDDSLRLAVSNDDGDFLGSLRPVVYILGSASCLPGIENIEGLVQLTLSDYTHWLRRNTNGLLCSIRIGLSTTRCEGGSADGVQARILSTAVCYPVLFAARTLMNVVSPSLSIHNGCSQGLL